MRRADEDSGSSGTDEMAVVDTFTKLIFGDSDVSEREIEIIQTLRVVNPDVWCDSHAQMGAYLRSLGVREMIQLVSQVKQQMARDTHLPSIDGASDESPSAVPTK